MTDRRKHVRVGIFALVTAALVAVALVAFAGLKFWKHHDHYYVLFDDTVLGLSAGAPVSLNGIAVGTVTDVVIAPKDLSKVQVTLEVDAGTPIHTDTQAFLSMAGLTGVRSIDLKGGSYAAPPLPQGGLIAAGLGTLDKLQAKAEMLADQSGKLMQRANDIFDTALKVTQNLDAATDPAALQAILESTRATSANLGRASANLDTASRGVIALVGETRTNLAQSLASVTATAKSASTLLDDKVAGFVDSAGSLVTDLRTVVHGNEATLTAATADIRQAARSFKELSREVREKPSRLLFSGNTPDRKLP